MTPAGEETPERVLDEYLVVLSQAGAVDALDRLVRRWTPRLLRYAARLLGGSPGTTETARDVVQETWIGALRGLRSLRDPAQFPAWIYGIATRTCADAIRASRRRQRLAARAGASNGTTVEPPVTAEDRFDLATAIRGLPTEQRAVLHLFYGAELSVEEVALTLAIPAGTVKSRLHYARESLKRHLGTGPSVRSRP
jgi:RNA polymerase sigma-70 factor, ECF subfamily